jgi:hypothetical protein
MGRRGRRTGSKNNEGSAAAAIGAPQNAKRSAATAGLGAMRTQSRELAKGSDEEGNDVAFGEVFFRACVLRHFCSLGFFACTREKIPHQLPRRLPNAIIF